MSEHCDVADRRAVPDDLGPEAQYLPFLEPNDEL
jgi:hypothetical protein